MAYPTSPLSSLPTSLGFLANADASRDFAERVRDGLAAVRPDPLATALAEVERRTMAVRTATDELFRSTDALRKILNQQAAHRRVELSLSSHVSFFESIETGLPRP